MVPLAHPSTERKLHLEFSISSSVFAGLTHVSNTHTQTDHAILITRGCTLCMRCGLITINLRQHGKAVAVANEFVGCCSTDNESLHRCCHLPNNFDSLTGYSLYFTTGFKTAPSKGVLAPIQYTVSWVHPSSHPKQHLDQFSCFSIAHGCDQQTHTDYAISVTIGHILLCDAAYRAYANIKIM